MIPPGAYGWINDWYDLHRLSAWLRDRRDESAYRELVRRRTLTEAEVDVDRRARAAIADDWEAIFFGRDPSVRHRAEASERYWSLSQALVIAELHLSHADEDRRAQLMDLRDAIGCLLLYEGGFIERLMAAQRRGRSSSALPTISPAARLGIAA